MKNSHYGENVCISCKSAGHIQVTVLDLPPTHPPQGHANKTVCESLLTTYKELYIVRMHWLFSPSSSFLFIWTEITFYF